MKKLYTVGVALALAAGSFAQNLIDLSLVGTYETGVFDDGAIEIVTYDAANKHVIAVNASTNSVDVFNISNPASITLGFSIDVSPYGKAANSVAFHNDVIAAAIENNNKQENGRGVMEVRGTSADVSELSARIYTLIEGETRIQFIKK